MTNVWGSALTKFNTQTTRRVDRLAAILLRSGERMNRETPFTRVSRIWTTSARSKSAQKDGW